MSEEKVMPEEWFEKYLSYLSAKHKVFVVCNEEIMALERKKAEIIYRLMPEYFK